MVIAISYVQSNGSGYGIPTGGHSMLIHKSNNNFSFFDPTVGCYSNMPQEQVAHIIKLKAQLGEIAIMDNKKFLQSNHQNLLQEALDNTKTLNQEETLWNGFVEEMKQKMNNATLLSLQAANIDTIDMDIDEDMKFNNTTKETILDDIKTKLREKNNIITPEDTSSDTAIFIECFIDFCKKNRHLEADDMRSNEDTKTNKTKEYAKDKQDIETAMQNLGFTSLSEDTPVKHYSEKLLHIKEQTLKQETEDIVPNVLKNQKKWFSTLVRNIQVQESNNCQI